MIVWNGNQSHEALVFLGAKGFLIDVRGISIDELGPATLWTETRIIEMSFDPGRFVGIIFNRGGSGFPGGAGPDALVVGGITVHVCLCGALLVEPGSLHVVLEVFLDGKVNLFG